ncbi:hypothetical protein PstZobell_10334 [Stutzerimonas stutzeri ATCC 14405 = CCUG 16156]|uniref:hypothetical protein n=1 Tax=Stutzerimonas stutzeri TaxID=316 RepID=UPI0002549855|nr:hypothetical protein [Stutzerimonas stutzeri]EHY77823.1 hypothetical protein PstZobell_10334 [Stutzerimonas stutzeri ATCC 14405 = CCUG 16156]QOZ96758.1 hypothetical protein Pstu14405_16130 [Stutzerimonas stutzeri]
MQSNNQHNTTEQFLKLPYDVLDATGFIAKGGEIVNITLQQKIVYCWMKQRCEFFAKDGREYFDNVDDIADSLKINRKTVLGAIQFFRDNGVLIADKKPLGGAREKWVFKRFCDISFVNTKDKEKAPVQAKEQPTQAPQELAAPTMDDFVPASAEWASEAVPMDAYDDFMPEPEDDGSCADALSYSEQEETLEQPVSVSVPAAKQLPASGIDGIDLSTLPDICYERNGSINDRMWDWLETRGFYVEDPSNCIVHLNGTRYAFIGRQFEVCTKQVEEEEFSPF